MSRFYGSINGSAKTEATRRGTVDSGLSGHIRGWDIGCRVECRVDASNIDIICVYATSGSNGSKSDRLIATLYDDGSYELHGKAISELE